MTENAQIRVVEEDNTLTIIASGELVLSNSDEFGNALKEASLHAESVAVDLREVIFIDTAVIQYLAKSAVTLIKRGKRLKVIVTADKQPKRSLDISGLVSLMDVER